MYLQDFETILGSVREKIRTPDLLIRSQTLYPAELRALMNSQRAYFITKQARCQPKIIP